MNNPKKKYIFISHSPYFHGAEICLLEMVMALRKFSECEVHVYIPKIINTPLKFKTELENVGAIVHYLDNPHWVENPVSFFQLFKKIRDSLSIYFQFLKILSSFKPDYVIVNTVVSNPVFAMAARIKKTKTIWFIHELGDKDHGFKFYLGKKLTFKIISRLSDKIFFNSKFTHDYFVNGKSSDKNRIIDYAVSYTTQSAPSTIKQLPQHKDDVWNILIAGRTAEGKGQIDLVYTMNELVNQLNIKNMHLTILGSLEENVYAENLIRITKENNLEKYIKFVSFSDNIANYFNASHIGVSASRNEAFGRMTVEYMRYGLITIGAHAGGTQEIIQDQKNGYIYEVGNYKQLSQLLLKITALDTSKITEIQEYALNYSKNRFSLENHFNQLITNLNN